jgi:hypothetical protein
MITPRNTIMNALPIAAMITITTIMIITTMTIPTT